MGSLKNKFGSDIENPMFYRETMLPFCKKNRTISIQNQEMRKLQKRFAKYIRQIKSWNEEKSVVVNLILHSYQGRFFYLTDICDAFSSVKLDRFLGAFSRASHNHWSDAKEFLQIFFSENGELITGGSASPAIFSLYCHLLLDVEIRNVIENQPILYTRYVDNLTFSSPKRIGAKTRKEIRRAMAKVGFRPNHGKSKVLDIKKGPINIMGLNMDDSRQVFFRREMLAKIHGLLHSYKSRKDVPIEVLLGYYGIFKDLYINHSHRAKTTSLSEKIKAQFQELFLQTRGDYF